MKPKRVHGAALVLLTPPVVSIALWGFIFVVGLIVEGWAIMTTPESLADLGLYAVVTTVIFYAIALTVAVVELLARWRKRRAVPVRPPEPASRTILRNWWAPAALAAGFTLLLYLIVAVVVLMTDRSAADLADVAGLGQLYLFLVALAYSMWLVVVAGQLWVDRTARRRQEATERRVAAGAGPAELALLEQDPAAVRAAIRRARRRERWWVTVLLPPSVVVAALVLFNQFGDLPDLFGLGPTGTWVVAITLGVLAAGAAIAYWWLTMHGLDAVTLAHVTVAGAELPDIDSVTDAAAAATGLSTGILTVRVHAEWRLVTGRSSPFRIRTSAASARPAGRRRTWARTRTPCCCVPAGRSWGG
jgi:hypothetical protein